MKLFLMLFAFVLLASASFAQEVEDSNVQPKTEKMFSEELTERLLENMRSRYSEKNMQTLLFRKKDLERQLRSPRLSNQTRQRLNLEYSVVLEAIDQYETR
ncbi:MAG: hypothetical protein J6P93_00595 [Alphaproteobacteria bacterium]|nr:hypothetical protein [Alphaproteobacteria bacterium]